MLVLSVMLVSIVSNVCISIKEEEEKKKKYLRDNQRSHIYILRILPFDYERHGTDRSLK